MSKKKVLLLLISLVFISMFSGIVKAQQNGGLSDAFDTIRQLFDFLPEILTLEKLFGGDAAAIFWAKFLIWILLFAAIYFGASKVFTDNNRIAVIIAIVISLMGALLIPNEILINIFQTYGLVAGIIVWTIPLAAGMFIAHKVDNKFLRALIYGLAAWILFSINETIVKNEGFANSSFPFFGLLFAVVIILFFWNLFSMFGEGGGARGPGQIASNIGNKFWDWATGNDRPGGGSDTSRDSEARDRDRRHEEATSTAMELNQKIGDLKRRLQEELAQLRGDELKQLTLIANLIKELGEIQEQLKTARGVR